MKSAYCLHFCLQGYIGEGILFGQFYNEWTHFLSSLWTQELCRQSVDLPSQVQQNTQEPRGMQR